jgi:flagellar protein FlaG
MRLWVENGGNDVINPIQPNSEVTILPAEAFPGQKTDKAQEILLPVVGRKEEIPTAREEIPREEIVRATERLNRLVGIINKQYKFSISERSRRVSVKIVDRATGEVIDEIPPKRVLDMLDSFTDMVGITVDKQS